MRRQHQRDACAAFLVAANSYADETNPIPLYGDILRSYPSGATPSHRQLEQQVFDSVVSASGFEQLRGPAAVVGLEGPNQVAHAAKQVMQCAVEVREFQTRRDALAPWDSLAGAHERLVLSIAHFSAVSSDHLNSRH
uniref:hypothetical protein n=1 Tax=Streptomyces anulatus TaxID=1892 RepID=UPI002F90A3BF